MKKIINYCIFFFIMVIVQCVIVIINNSLSYTRQKETRANCGINFQRLSDILQNASKNGYVLDYGNPQKIIKELKITNAQFIILSRNEGFLEQLLYFEYDTNTADTSTKPYPVISDCSPKHIDEQPIHFDGWRHVLMSNGKTLFISGDEFINLILAHHIKAIQPILPSNASQ